MEALHELRVVHCDVKPENITLSNQYGDSVKLIDYGSAIFIEDNDSHVEIQTLPYRAPEITLRANYGHPIDIWSVGCIIYELVTGRVLFDQNNEALNLAKAVSLNISRNFSCFE